MSERAAENLRQSIERDVRAAAAEHERYVSELDASAPRRRRLAAGAPGDEPPGLGVLGDRTLPSATRVEVIQRLSADLTRDGSSIELLLAIVQDTADAAGVRAAALTALGTAAFQVARFGEYQQAYEDALRTLLGDPEPALREAAAGVLALRHDPVVQQTLLDGLRGTGPLPVARERAIQLLAEDDHLDNLPWLDELYASDSEDVRQEAVRLMGSYPQAGDTLEGILRDKREAAEVRQQSAASLRGLEPARFEAVAKVVATDDGDDPDVRTAFLTTLTHLGTSAGVYGDDEFLRRLEDIGSDESVPQVAQGARDLIRRRPEPLDR
jgi:hypothetical protein